MTRRFQLAIWLMWLALPLTAWSYWSVWDRLPARMAVHFDSYWDANGWTSRELSFRFALGVTVFMLVVFTIACYAVLASVRNGAVPIGGAWGLLVFFYLVMGVLVAVNHWVVEYNLRGQGRQAYSVRLQAPADHDFPEVRFLKLHS